MTEPSEIFDPWSNVVTTWDDLIREIDQILNVHGSGELVWRGTTDASWALHSSLYRRLKYLDPGGRVSENDVVREEKKILDAARIRWRLDNMSALEILAHIQHYGGPTRLIDVTENPLIAVWFAVEQRYSSGLPTADTDSRVFCFYTGEQLRMDSFWGERQIPWHGWLNKGQRLAADWGTGRVRRIWKPPFYNSRIAAQNAAFVIDGVPFAYAGSNNFTKGPGLIHDRWQIDEILSASSIPLKLNQPQRSPQTTNSTPAFTFRIAASARKPIRDRLEKNFGYSTSSMYSDLFGLAQHVAPHLPTATLKESSS